VFGAVIHTEQEGVGRGLSDRGGFPCSSCEAAKDVVLGSLNNSQRPSLFIAFTMEIVCAPPIGGSIINP